MWWRCMGNANEDWWRINGHYCATSLYPLRPYIFLSYAASNSNGLSLRYPRLCSKNKLKYPYLPNLVLVPPTVVLQHNQSEVEVNCSAWSQEPASLQWIIISLFNQETNHSLLDRFVKKIRWILAVFLRKIWSEFQKGHNKFGSHVQNYDRRSFKWYEI